MGVAMQEIVLNYHHDESLESIVRVLSWRSEVILVKFKPWLLG
jgi:hypothetical protein